MAWTRNTLQPVVVFASRVGVLYYHGHRGATGVPLCVEPAKHMGNVRFLSWRGPRGPAGCATVHESLERLHIHMDSCRQTLDDAAD